MRLIDLRMPPWAGADDQLNRNLSVRRFRGGAVARTTERGKFDGPRQCQLERRCCRYSTRLPFPTNARPSFCHVKLIRIPRG